MPIIKRLFVLLAFAWLAGPSLAEPLKILFVGNSFTYTRPPALNYNTDAVTDLNLQNSIDKPLGNDPELPQPWGGVPGIFKALADQSGVDVVVKHSLRGGATLRGHLLNTNPAGWDLRANIASERWDVVVLQGNSTEAVDRMGGDFAQFNTYIGLLERFIHVGDAHSYREALLYPGGSNALRNIPANPNANPNAAVYLYQTWARPDLAYPAGTPYAGEPLETMQADLHTSYAQAAQTHAGITGVVPVGDAFLRAVHDGVSVRNPYDANERGISLWWPADQFHPSGHGAYLSALTMFGAISGIDPASFSATEQAARDLGIAPQHALQLQRTASRQLLDAGHALTNRPCVGSGQPVAVARGCAGMPR
jgi:hypothetical protein